MLIAFVAAELAQPILPSAPPSPSAAAKPLNPADVAAADRLLTAMDYDRMMQRTLDAIVAQMVPTIKKSLEAELEQPVDDELVRRLAKVQEEALQSQLVDDPKIRRAIAILYARHLNAAELDRLATLYSDPVMKKWSEAAPEIAADTFPLVIDLVQAHQDELKEKVIKVAADYFAEKEHTSPD